GPVGGTENVLDAVDETKARATFFLVGDHIETTGRKRLLPRIRNYGAGNHSYSHWAKESDFVRRTPQEYLEDFRRADTLILGQPGKVVPCRLPGNQPTQKKAFVKALMEDGRNVIGWDAEISSSLTKTPDKAVAEILSHRKDTVIVLFHDRDFRDFNRRRGKEDLVRIINSLKATGHKLEKFGSLQAPSEEPGPVVKLGIDVLIEKNIDLLKGKRIGLITNQTGTNSKLEQTIDLLHKHPEVNLVALFSPEHGLRGMVKAGRQIQSSHDEYTGLPIHSLYGKTRRPTPGMLRGLDVLIFDIQDIGARSYTYISTMAYAMEEAGKNRIEFIVLDRPNPLGGLKIEGPVLDPSLKSFIGLYPIPTVHGMTV
ncbi:DUF1343 domain-containing protein, partial [bacterium]|nr:DUF1343 domain-containing protein [bacterium]